MIENEIIFYENWFENNVVFVNDILKENNFIMILDEFKLKYGFEVFFLIYSKLKVVIKIWVKKENVKKVKMLLEKYIKLFWEVIFNLVV